MQIYMQAIYGYYVMAVLDSSTLELLDAYRQKHGLLWKCFWHQLTEEYDTMASSLIEMGASNNNVDSKAFARDLEKIFSSIQDLDTEIVVATARGTNTNATAVSANLVVDERQMNALFLDVIRVSESYGLKFPRGLHF